MKTRRFIAATCAALSLVTAISFARDYSTQFRSDVSKQVDRGNLQRDVPTKQSSRLSKGTLGADAIIGWYDKGHNYHAQKMGQRVTPEQKYQRYYMRGRAVQ